MSLRRVLSVAEPPEDSTFQGFDYRDAKYDQKAETHYSSISIPHREVRIIKLYKSKGPSLTLSHLDD